MRKDKTLQIRLEDSHRQLLDEICDAKRATASEMLREMIESYHQTIINTNPVCPEAPKGGQMPTFSRTEKKRSFTVGEMYSGPGGIGLALNNTRLKAKGFDFAFRHSWATDYDKDTCRTYQENVLKNHPGSRSICADIRDLDLSELPAVDGFLYGFPCNDFSHVGESKGLHGKFGGLYKYGVDYIDQNNPLFVFAENVSGLSSANAGRAFKEILAELNHAGKFGYNLTVHHYKFEDYGVPQSRHRYIVIGIRGDLGLTFQVPQPSMHYMTCREAIENPPIPQDAKNNELTRQSETVVERLKYIKPGENAWTAALPEHLQLNVKGARISQIYKRLDPDKPAYTVTGSGGGGTHIYHWEEPRALTNRERARLQTFPDDFVFYGSKESVRAQIGMAVPYRGASIILEALLKTFAGQKYPHVAPSHGCFEPNAL